MHCEDLEDEDLSMHTVEELLATGIESQYPTLKVCITENHMLVASTTRVTAACYCPLVTGITLL